MYAHQVIEDLKTVKNDFIRTFLDNFNKVQHYHMGECNDIYDVTKNTQYEDIKKYIKLPYDECWFDGTENIVAVMDNMRVDISKIGYYVSSPKEFKPDELLIIPFVYVKNFKWIHLRFAMRVSINLYQYWLFDVSDGVAKPYNVDIPEDIQKYYFGFFKTIARFLVILNCKNIFPMKIKAPDKLNKKRIRNNKLPIFDYHVLTINPFGKSKKDYKPNTIPLSHNRVHLCCGHFKEYTKEHPLLGRHAGLFWWQPHVRGQNKEGMVHKDYSIKSDVMNA